MKTLAPFVAEKKHDMPPSSGSPTAKGVSTEDSASELEEESAFSTCTHTLNSPLGMAVMVKVVVVVIQGMMLTGPAVITAFASWVPLYVKTL